MQFFTHVFVVAIQTELHNTTQSARIYFLRVPYPENENDPWHLTDCGSTHKQQTAKRIKWKKKKLRKTPSADQEIAKNACQHAFNRMWNFIMHRKRRKNSRSAKIQTKPTKKQWEQMCRMAHVLFKFIPFPRPKLRLCEFFFPSPTLFFNCYRRGLFRFSSGTAGWLLWSAEILALVNQFGSERLQLLHLFDYSPDIWNIVVYNF